MKKLISIVVYSQKIYGIPERLIAEVAEDQYVGEIKLQTVTKESLCWANPYTTNNK
jgi:hypothetical protein